MITRHFIIRRSQFPDDVAFCVAILLRLDLGETVHVCDPQKFQLVRNGGAFMARDNDGMVIGTYPSVREAVTAAVEAKRWGPQ